MGGIAFDHALASLYILRDAHGFTRDAEVFEDHGFVFRLRKRQGICPHAARKFRLGGRHQKKVVSTRVRLRVCPCVHEPDLDSADRVSCLFIDCESVQEGEAGSHLALDRFRLFGSLEGFGIHHDAQPVSSETHRVMSGHNVVTGR